MFEDVQNYCVIVQTNSSNFGIKHNNHNWNSTKIAEFDVSFLHLKTKVLNMKFNFISFSLHKLVHIIEMPFLEIENENIEISFQ